MSKLKQYSYADQKSRSSRRLRVFLWVFVLISSYMFLTGYLFSMKVMNSDSMQPEIQPGDRFVIASYGINQIFSKITGLKSLPLKRGIVVLVARMPGHQKTLPLRLADRLIRFFTAGRQGVGNYGSELFIKRVLAIPGDEIWMSNYILHVRPFDSPYEFTEFEVALPIQYDVNIPQSTALWDSAIPFSGNFERTKLKDNEVFVLSDDRSNTNDSRTWGAISHEQLSGKILLRFWPLGRFGIP
jgi:signal peptidase I